MISMKVTVSIWTRDPEMVVDRLLIAKQNGVLVTRLAGAKLKVNTYQWGLD